MRLFLLLLAVALGCFAAPAQAAEAIDCPLGKLSTADRAAIKQEMLNEYEKGQYRPGWSAAKRAIASCAARHRWNGTVRELARQVIYASMELETVDDLLRARGTDALAIERFLGRHPEVAELRRDQLLLTLLTGLRSDGIAVSADAEALVGYFVGARRELQRCREAFAEA